MPRKKLDHPTLRARVKQETPDRIKRLALALGFRYGGLRETGEDIPAIGAFLDTIALLSDNEESIAVLRLLLKRGKVKE